MRAIVLLVLLSGCACFHRAAAPPPAPGYSAPTPTPPVTQRRGG